jgi:hypothetical protein
MVTSKLTIATERERHALYALALMCAQYLTEGDTLDHLCMGGGEEAYKVLEAHGLIAVKGRRARWTEAGEQLLALHLNQRAFPT